MSDVLIVGGGAAGSSAALTLGRVRRSVTLVDEGSPRNRAASTVHNVLSRDGAGSGDFRSATREQLRPYDTVEIVVDRVVDLVVEAGEFGATFGSGRTESFAKVLLASGIEDALPPIPGVADLWGTSVLHCPYCHGWEHRDAPLAVIGDDARAVSQALHLVHLSSTTTICTNGGSSFDPDARTELAAAGVEVRSERIRGLGTGEGGEPQAIEFENGDRLTVDAVFVGPSIVPNNTLATALGCELTDDGTVRVNAVGGTSVAGVFAAGDLARNPDVPFRGQLVLAASSGLLAAMAIEEELLRGISLGASGGETRTWRRKRGRPA